MNPERMRRPAVLLLLGFLALLVQPPDRAFSQERAKIAEVSDARSISYGEMHVLDYQGAVPSSPRAGRDIPQMPGWPKPVGCNATFAPTRGLIFADLNNDGTLEIIASSTDSKIYAWDYTGAAMPGFPVTTTGWCQGAPSAGDLDGDGDLEIVQFTRGLTNGGRFYILDHQGNVLPGFPISLNNNNMEGAPALYDLDDDGDLEILVPERAYPIGRLHVFEYNGTEWGGRWPVELDHVPTCTPAIGDVNADGKPEVVYLSYNSIYVLDVTGRALPGWPKQLAGANFSYQSPALADLDGDGDLEIAVGAHKDAPGCYIFHHDGTAYAGWPKIVDTWTYCPPTIADLDGDGSMEVLDGQAGQGPDLYSNCFFVWSSAGVLRPGFPYAQAHGGGSDGPITIADVNNDGLMEIFADHNIASAPSGDQVQGYLFGVDAAGNDLPGFPLRPEGFTYMNGATIGDVDGDGDYELGVISYYETSAYVNLYDLDGTWHPGDVAWETYHKINRRGGLSGSEDRLSFQGYFGLSSTVNLYLHDEPGRTAYLWASAGTAKAHSLMYGWFYLDPQPLLFLILFNYPIPASGEIKLPITVPPDPGLSGATLYLQGMIYDPGMGKGKTTNMLGKTIQ